MSELDPQTDPECNRITILLHSTPKPPRNKKRASNLPKHLSEDEAERFFGVIDDVRNRAIYRIMYHAGLRASEAGALLMRDYNSRTERMYIRRKKGSNSGEHRLCREEARALKAWLKVRGPKAGPIFTSREHGPISRYQIFRWFQAYAELADLPEYLRHPHALKHSCCVHLLSKGFNVEQVQDWVGHARIQSTMEYTKVTNSRRDEMAERLRDWR